MAKLHDIGSLDDKEFSLGSTSEPSFNVVQSAAETSEFLRDIIPDLGLTGPLDSGEFAHEKNEITNQYNFVDGPAHGVLPTNAGSGYSNYSEQGGDASSQGAGDNRGQQSASGDFANVIESIGDLAVEHTQKIVMFSIFWNVAKSSTTDFKNIIKGQ